MRILQIDVTCNILSTGKIAEGIGKEILRTGGQSYIAYGRYSLPSRSLSIRIGSDLSVICHVLLTRILDKHGLGSVRATKQFLQLVLKIKPDIIHLHEVHGYYLNYELLFRFLKRYKFPIVWTQHCCWAFTGHCASFDYNDCTKWKSLCHDCQLKREYPASYFIDNSKQNYLKKKALFTSVENMQIVAVSRWMESLIRESFLNKFPIRTIYNGVDTEIFKPTANDIREKYKINDKFLILGVAANWSERKGLYDFIRLNRYIDRRDTVIMLVGLTKTQIRALPEGIIGIGRVLDQNVLSKYFSAADVFFNPTYQEAFGLTNIEALSCGTPVVTYATGGSSETISDSTGIVSRKGDLNLAIQAIMKIKRLGKKYYSRACRDRAIKMFKEENSYTKYLDLYQEILMKHKG
ncbi:MAG: glycosyltransferase [Candidatus Saccharicenans sp.]